MSFVNTCWIWFMGIAVGSAMAFSTNCATAQIIPDRTLPNNSIINSNGSTINITGGTQAGGNLFHSFQQFSVPTGSTAFFNNALDIQNIISRVTGGLGSDIDGLIRANGTANLFLINPSGITFGKNASLNVGGSFVASTASRLKFADGTEFNATSPQNTPLLTISVPLGLQFGANAGSIISQSQVISDTGERVGLQVLPGKTLAFVGGNLVLDGGYITAPNGRIELGSVAGNSLVSLIPTLTGYSLGYENVKGFQDIRLQNSALVSNTNTNSNRDGGIQVQGANVILSDGSSIQVDLLGFGAGASLNVNASNLIQLSGTGSSLLTQAESSATGSAGDLKINTSDLRIQNGAQVLSDTLGAAKGGSVSVNAAKSVQLNGIGGSRLLAQTESGATGGAGDVSITTPVLQVQNRAEVSDSTLGAGRGGSLNINAAELYIQDGARVLSDTGGTGTGASINVNSSNLIQLSGTGSSLLTQAESSATGGAGDLKINTSELRIQDGAQVSSDTLGAAKGGSVSVDAAKSVQLNGIGGSRLLAQTESGATGGAGDVSITTPVLQVQNRAEVSDSTLGAGRGGSLNINAAELYIQDGALVLSDTRGTGTGASINVNGSNLIQLSGTGSSLLTQAESTATGSAGDVKINTSELRIQDGTQVSSDTLGAAKGGSISVNVAKSVQLNGANSRLLAQTESKGDAGDVNINTPTLQVQNGAQVLSNTLGPGRAGSVDINTTTMVTLSGRSTDGKFASGLFAQTERSATGDAGNLRIITPTLLVENGAQVSAGTLGAGRAGSVDINASTIVQLSGRSADGQFASGLFAQTERNATGEAGNLSITTPTLLVENGAQVSAGTLGIRKGGSINVNATKLVQLRGPSSGLFAQTDAPDATVDAGNLSITTSILLVENGAQVSVNNTGTGRAGNISITTGSGQLNNGIITARTSSGNGGNLMLDITGNLLLLRNGSQISTTAGTAQRGGNGGNIMINAPNGLIVATPNENSDITANAFSGTGGRIIINSLDIFGIQQRNREDLMLLLRTNDPDQLNPQNSQTNDITAFSQISPTLNGQIAISTPNVDPSQGLVQLPYAAVNIAELITSSCAAFANGGSQFTSTGRGGLPQGPDEPLTNDVVWTDTRLPVTTMQQHSSKKPSAKPRLKPKAEPVAILPATGWVDNGKGEVTLISSAPNANGLGFTPVTCPMQR